MNAENVEDRTLVFIRNIVDIEEFLHDPNLLGKYIDLDSNQSIDQNSKERLNKLKQLQLPNAFKNLKNTNLDTYTVKNISF